MSNTIIPVHMSDSLLRDAAIQAERTGMSVEDWLLSLANESIFFEQVADRFFRHPPDSEAGQKLLEILSKTKNNPPMSGDELE